MKVIGSGASDAEAFRCALVRLGSGAGSRLSHVGTVDVQTRLAIRPDGHSPEEPWIHQEGFEAEVVLLEKLLEG